MKRPHVLTTIFGLLLVLPVAAFAQSPNGADLSAMKKMMAQKEAREAMLVRLQTNREAFVSEISNAWSPAALEKGFDVSVWQREFERVLASQPSEKLIAAREAASYNDVVGLLTGRRSKSSASPQQGLVAQSLGDEASDLVYFPVAPCRIIDTRFGTGIYAGRLVHGTPKDFSHNIGVGAQGGNGAGCGIPTDPAAIALTIVAVAPLGPGDLRAWRLLDPVPNASVINYTNVPGLNVANTTILPTCQICGNDFTIQADVNDTHVVADIVGYFWNPTPCAAGTVQFHGDCFETATRAATSVFLASDACHSAGGRLANPLELRSIRGEGGITLGDEWTDSIDSEDNITFHGMTIADGGAFAPSPTLNAHVYRCVFTQFAH
jgi:hypothetical protein